METPDQLSFDSDYGESLEGNLSYAVARGLGLRHIRCSDQDGDDKERMLMKLLVAIDSSAAADVVIEEVAARPWPEGTAARVLYVLDNSSYESDFLDVAAYAEQVEGAANDFIESKAEHIAAAGLRTVAAIVKGYPRTTIVEQAKEHGADFIFLGSRGHNPLAELLLGSVASSVVRFSPCAVEVVRAPKRQKTTPGTGKRILLATDGSDCSEVAVRSVAARPWPEGTQMRVISIADVSFPEAAWFFNQTVMEELEEKLIAKAKEASKTAQQILLEVGWRASHTVLRGQAKARIIEEAKEWEADLIVVGSHGKRGLERALRGSVSESVVTHAPCSVGVIR